MVSAVALCCPKQEIHTPASTFIVPSPEQCVATSLNDMMIYTLDAQSLGLHLEQDGLQPSNASNPNVYSLTTYCHIQCFLE